MYCQHGHMFARYVSIFQPLKKVIDMLNIAIFSESWHFIRPLCVNMLNTALFYVCWYFIQFSTACQFADNHVLVCQYFIPPTLVWPCSMYVGILFGLSMAMFYVYVVLWGGISTLVQMVPPCSIYVGILFSHSMWVCLVQLCSTYVGILFGLSTLVRVVQPCSIWCMLVFYSVLVTLVHFVWLCSMYNVILFRLSHVSTVSMAVFYVQCSIWFQHVNTRSTTMFYVCCHFIPPYKYLICQLCIWPRFLRIANKSARNPALQ